MRTKRVPAVMQRMTKREAVMIGRLEEIRILTKHLLEELDAEYFACKHTVDMLQAHSFSIGLGTQGAVPFIRYFRGRQDALLKAKSAVLRLFRDHIPPSR